MLPRLAAQVELCVALQQEQHRCQAERVSKLALLQSLGSSAAELAQADLNKQAIAPGLKHHFTAKCNVGEALSIAAACTTVSLPSQHPLKLPRPG